MKKLLSILLTVVMVFSVSSAFAYERGEYEATPVPVTITSANTLDVTRQFDENNPDKRNISENRWVTAYKD